MKKTLYAAACALLLLTDSVCTAEPDTDLSLFNDLSAAYSSAFYPGAADYASRLVSQFPDSAYTGRALVMQGECFVRMGRNRDAENSLARASSFISADKTLAHACAYWDGRALYALGEYLRASWSFYDSCRVFGEKGVYYADGVLYGGRSCFSSGLYKEAVSLFEYVVSHGKKYAQSDYEESVVKLADSYNRIHEYKNCTGLFEKYTRGDLSSRTYALFSLYAGDAYSALDERRKAYDAYLVALKSGEKTTAAAALQKAYDISAAYRGQIDDDPGSVLAQVQPVFEDDRAFVSGYWMRLAIDAYGRNEYDNASRYFDNADSGASPDMKQLAALYRAEIIYFSGRVGNAQTYLADAEKKEGLDERSASYEKFCTLMLKYSAEQGAWKDALGYAEKITDKDHDSLYYTAAALYGTGQYERASDILGKTAAGKNTSDPHASALYALSLARQNRTAESLAVYAMLDKDGALDDASHLSYAETLFAAGRYSDAYLQAVKSARNDAQYVAGLAEFNNREWKEAENCFTAYRRTAQNSAYAAYALFYTGYAQYRLGRTEDSYTSLSSFARQNPASPLAWTAYSTAANAAVQSGMYDKAAAQAETAAKTAPDEQSRENAVLLCAEIYTDAGRYDDAVKTLAPYAAGHSPFGLKCMYQTSQIFVKQNDIERADQMYARISAEYPSDDLAEESAYRRGELYYTAHQYETALKRFAEYDRAYAGGKYSDASWYFSADCYAKTGNTDRAIMQNNALLKKYPAGTFAYGAHKNLMTLYRASGDYADALVQARMLLSSYGDQAGNDGIGTQAAELEKLAAGSGEAAVKKQTEYEKNGKLSTVEGRITGTELAAMYASSASTLKQGADLAGQLLAVQKQHIDAESAYAAKNAGLLGLFYRKEDRNGEAASMYLLAAQYFRMNRNDSDAAAALYNAADAFTAAGKDGDAAETVKTLRSLYPQSRQAQSFEN